MAMTGSLKATQKFQIIEALPSWLDPHLCTISPTPATGKKVEYWRTTYRCPGCHAKHQAKAYLKAGSTQASVAGDMAQKIDDAHGRCNVKTTETPASTAGVMSSSEMVHEAISIAQVYEKRNRELHDWCDSRHR